MQTTAERASAEFIRDWRRHGAVKGLATLRGSQMFEAARLVVPGDDQSALKAASPASQTGWGSQLGQTPNAAFLGILQGRSAAAALFERSLEIDLRGITSVNLPRVSGAWPLPGWIAEGAPWPVIQGAFAADTLGPVRKLGAVAVLTRELMDLSGPAAEQIVGDLMEDACGRALDASLFSSTAADATRPAGIFAGVSALTPTATTITATPDRIDADFGKLLAAIVAGGGGADVMFLAAPAQAFVAARRGYNVTVAPSFAAGTIAAVDVNAFAWSAELPPQIESANAAVLHLESSTPAQIGTAGTPPVVAAPARSTFQTDCVALRMRLPATWQKRNAAAAQLMTGVNW